ncbi:MAG: nitrate- and nitrite sensing domain-containing protein, partial [Sciscionella sp.]|nr:nitrate- and nitrite sensing domain-containing protein [Sciscionella sp.]
MLVPMIALAVLGWLIVNDNLDGASRYDAFSEQAGLANALATVADQLQSERDQVLMYNASNRSDGAAVDSDQAQQVDSSVDYFRGELSSASGLDPGFASALHSASTALNGRGALRQAAGGDHETDQALLGGYDKLLDTSLRAIRLAPLVTGGDTTLYRQASSLDALRQAKEQYTRGNAIMLAAAEHGSITSSQLDALNAAQSSYSTQIGIFTANASQADQRAYASAQSSADFTERGRLRQQLLSAGDGGSVDVSPAAIQHSGEAAAASLSKVEQNLDQELLSAASGGYSASKRAAVFTTIVIAAILALACLIAVLMIRALIESVHRLRDDTLDVANTRLPESVRKVFAADDPIAVANEPIIEPVGVSSTDEIGDVARNVDAVHSKATELAAEHAARHGDLNAVLVNVSRRGQALVERQLGLIDQLETGEVDPQQLANLYELDRLATRMRRNSENLLVLSGNGLGKQQPAPVSISELLTAAVGEVEQYSRIRVDVPVECAVLGEVVNDLLHLLAELMENATGHSDGRSTVLVRTRLTRDGELSVKIIDNGIGMSEDNLREANRRLAEPAPARVQPSTTMGLDVVAKLAKPHGITVDLRPNVPQPYVGQPNVGQPNVRRPKAGRGDGLVATVLVPAALVADAAQAMTIVLPIDPAQYGG